MKGRSLIVGAALVFGIPATLPAQGQLGIKGGATFGNVANTGVFPGNLATRTGLAGGFYLGSAGVMGFGVEGLYARRSVAADNVVSAEARVDYIDVPVYLKVTVPTPGVQPFIYAGPQGSYEVRCRTAQGGACDASTAERKRWSAAAIIGAGVRLGGTFGIEGRYVYGLTDFKPGTVTSSSSYQHRSFMLLGSLGR